MDATLKTICGLLKSDDNLRRCGAAVVLAELAPKSADVVKALGEALPSAVDPLQACLLQALEAIGSADAVPYVMPLLESEDLTTKMRAAAIVAAAGTGVAPEILKQLEQATRSQKPVFIDMLARMHTRDTFQRLLGLLQDPDFAVVKETCDAIRRHARSASPAERLKLHQQVVQFMGGPKIKGQERVLTSCLLILGHIGRSEAAAIILKSTKPNASPYVRKHALIGLKELDYTGSLGAKVLAAISPYLDEADAEVARHTLEIIAHMPSAVMKPAQWRRLLKNRHASARAVAARRLAEADTTEVNALLMELLKHEDNEVLEIAAGALSGHKQATPMLVKALLAESEPESAWRLAKILKPHSAALDKKTVGKLAELAAKERLAGKPRHEAILYVVNHADPHASESVLLEVGLEHKKAGRWAEAVDCLRRLLHTAAFTPDVSYALSVCDLKVSHKELAPQFRADDHALRGFLSLLRRNRDDLLARLQKDKTLDSQDLYYVGFHFSEGAGDENLFGNEVLKHVVKRWPRSEEATTVRTRLGLMASAEKKAARGKKAKKSASPMS